MALVPIEFDEPLWLVILLLLLPTWWIAWGTRKSVSPGKLWTSIIIRSLVLCTLAFALADPSWVKKGEGLTVMMIADVSRSVPLPLQKESEEFLQQLVEAREDPSDRVGVITIARDASVSALPESGSIVSTGNHGGDLSATNLASAVRLALALLPQDTASRIMLVSDGNETMDSVMNAVEIAESNGIPVDVIPLAYEHPNEIVVEDLKAPARARLGQSSDLRVFIRSQEQADGTLMLWHNEVPVDLDPDSSGMGMRLRLSPGPTVMNIPLSLDQSGAHRFRVVFEPDAASVDAILENNSGEATTFVSGQGRVLIIDDSGLESEAIRNALVEGGIEVEVASTSSLSGGAAFLNGFEAVILANIPRWAITNEQDRILHAYVHDLGGGLLMLGGNESFGAGGWIDSETAKVLPVKLDPPQTRQLPRGALALIMHSCEMPQGNYWGQRVAIAAIEVLSRLDYIGIITFNWNVAGNNGISWAYPMQLAGDKSNAIAAARQMVVGDMPDFAPAMETALKGLQEINAGQKHVIIISDGDASPPSQSLLNKYKASSVTITTVMVAGHGSAIDRRNMQAVATQTGGTPYVVNNPKNLPKIFIKEANMIQRSLIVEGSTFIPKVSPQISGPMRGYDSLPSVLGYVLTVPRDGLGEIPAVITTSEGNDPLYAYWNYGLGKSVAFTSDVAGRWGAGWTQWSEFRGFWEQTVRWLMRPPSPQNIAMRTSIDGERAVVELDAISNDNSFLNYLKTDAKILSPDGSINPMTLKQIGPGRYRGEFDVTDRGGYLVNVHFPGGIQGEALGSIQSAVSIPYAKEFKSVRDNSAMLQAVADRTGGRFMRMSDPQLLDAFDRTGLEVPSSPRQIWDVLAIIAACLFILDVAVRRISLDTDAARRAAQAALARTNQAGTESVTAWKRARAAATTGRTGGATRDDEEATRRFDAEEQGVDPTQFDASASQGGPAGEPGSQPRRPSKADQPDPDLEQSHTSRLLKAKRRASRPEEQDDG